MMRKNPGYALVAILALAIGIGANSTVFVTVNAMLLRPLPFRDLDRVVAVWTTVPAQHEDHVSVTPADFHSWREQATAFDGIAAGHGWNANLTGKGLPERLEGYQVTGDFFRMLGIKPMLGRAVEESDQEPGNNRVVVLSYGLWKNRFASDAAIVGRSITLNGQAMTVVGVMPREFDFPLATAIWGPLALTPVEQADRNDGYLKIVGRIKPGVSLADAQAQMDTIASRLARAFPDSNSGHGARVVPIVRDLNDVSRQFLLLLMAAAGFVLLLACANIANLQLARATSRQKELALRTALGASRGRLLRQMLVESELLAIAGGGLGLLLAAWSTDATRASLPPFIVQHIAGLQHLNIDGWVLAFTGGVAIVAGLLSGVLPAVHGSWHATLNDVLKEGGRATSGGIRQRLRGALAVSEVTLALVLLIGSGLLVQGFRALASVHQGFDPSHVLTFRLSLPAVDYPRAQQRAAAYEAITAKLGGLAGIEAVAPVSSVPSGWGWNQTYFTIEGQAPRAPGEMRVAVAQEIGPQFLRALRIPLLRGRDFTSSDGPDTQPVVLISDSFARRYWPHGDVLGRRIRLGAGEKEPWRTVVGIVGDVRLSTFDQPFITTYVPVAQVPPQSTSFVLRATGDPMALSATVRAQVASVDATLPVYDIRTQEQVISDNLSGVQFSARMMIAFGILSLLLAGAGIYAVISYSVAQRTHEIGVRMALGARPADVMRMIVAYAAKLAGAGVLIGLPLSYGITKILSSTVLGLIHPDVIMFGAFVLVLGAVALLAGYVPARHATHVDPLEALRCE